MTYIFFYVVGLILIWHIYKFGWIESLKMIIKVIVPSALIILFNIKAGRLLFINPLLGLTSILPTSIFIFKGSRPLVIAVNNWIDKQMNGIANYEDVVETDAVSIED